MAYIVKYHIFQFIVFPIQLDIGSFSLPHDLCKLGSGVLGELCRRVFVC